MTAPRANYKLRSSISLLSAMRTALNTHSDMLVPELQSLELTLTEYLARLEREYKDKAGDENE